MTKHEILMTVLSDEFRVGACSSCVQRHDTTHKAKTRRWVLLGSVRYQQVADCRIVWRRERVESRHVSSRR